MTEENFSKKIAELGGCAYIVGGWVRDVLRGVAAKDKDYAVAGIEQADFERTFSSWERVGKSFPVYIIEIDGAKCEVAFARTEQKTGDGYTGFTVHSDRRVTLEDDLYRRDTTMNSIALRLIDGVIIDPYGGRSDIEQRLIRPVSPHFADDPVRALRAARQAAELDFTITEQTKQLMKLCKAELATEPPERLLAEMKKALATQRPSVFFTAMKETGLLEAAFPWLSRLIGQTQPSEYHPEGDAFNHTMEVLDKTAAATLSVDARFCALVHDIGKGVTPSSELPHHLGHEHKGLEVLADWNSRMTLPRHWIRKAEFVIREHMRITTLRKPGKIVDFIIKLSRNPLEFAELTAIISADNGCMPLPLLRYDKLLAAINSVDCRAVSKKASAENKKEQIPAMIREARIRACKNLL